MNPSIRKLYNVLVVGGALAAGLPACTKPVARKTAPAAAVEPAPAPVSASAPVAVEPEATGVRGWS